MQQSINPEPKRVVNYLDNEDFKKALNDYKLLCQQMAPEVPRVPNYIGDCFIKIANGMARRPNFSGYSWKEEMIGDAIEMCLRNIDKFDTERGTSALAYFSQVVWYCFLGRIALEKKQSKIKREIVRYAGVDTFSLQGHDEDGEFTLNLQEFLTSLGDDEPQPQTQQKKERPIKEGPLEGFM